MSRTWEAREELEGGPQVKKGMGWGTEVHGDGWRLPGSGASEVGLVLLELHHEVVDVDELGPGRQGSELRLRQHPVEAMIELDQLGQRSLLRESHGGMRGGVVLRMMIRSQVRAHPELWAQLVVEDQGSFV